MIVQKKLDAKARRAIDSVRKTELIEMRNFAHEFETLAEFEEKMSVKIEETAAQFSKEGNIDVSKQRVDTLKEELKPEIRKSFELAQVTFMFCFQCLYPNNGTSAYLTPSGNIHKYFICVLIFWPTHFGAHQFLTIFKN